MPGWGGERTAGGIAEQGAGVLHTTTRGAPSEIRHTIAGSGGAALFGAATKVAVSALVGLALLVALLFAVQALIARQQRAFNAGFIGRTVDVLLEKPGRLPGQLVGRTPYLQTVQVMAPASLIGEVVTVAIAEMGTNTLFGAIDKKAGTPVLTAAGAES